MIRADSSRLLISIFFFPFRTDIIFVTPDRETKVLVANDTVSEKFELRDLQRFLVKPTQDQNCLEPAIGDYMSSPHSTSFLDLNGDCMADIFMQKTRFVTDSKGKQSFQHYYEIYLARMVDDSLKYCLDR